MLKYFDLNERFKKAFAGPDCSSDDESPEISEIDEKDSDCAPGAPGEIKHLSISDQLIMYLGVLMGVLFSSYVGELADGKAINIVFTLSIVIVSLIVALMIIPVVYEKLNINPAAPYIVQLGIFVQNGVFWYTIISSIGRIF